MRRKKKLTLIFVGAVIIIGLFAILIQPSTSTPHKECELNPCDCQCYLKGQVVEYSIGTTSCKTDCKELFDIIGCKYVGLECPYGMTACVIVDAINDVFISKQCEIVKGE